MGKMMKGRDLLKKLLEENQGKPVFNFDRMNMKASVQLKGVSACTRWE